MRSPGKGAMNIDCLRCEKAPSLFDIPHRMAASVLWSPTFFADRRDIVGQLARDWQLAAIFTAQSGRPFSVWNGAAFSAGGDYNADGGGGAVGGGFYDRPDAPVSGLPVEFLDPGFPERSLRREPLSEAGRRHERHARTEHVPRASLHDAGPGAVAQLRTRRARSLQVRVDAYNALNTLNLYLPNADLSLSNFGKSTQAFDARTIQIGARLLF